MANNFFNSEASNYLVSVASRVGKMEKVISKRMDAESMVALYNVIQCAADMIEQEISNIEQRINTKEQK